MNLEKMRQQLTGQQFAALVAEVAKLEAAIATGAVRGGMLADAKFIINRRVEDALESYDETTSVPYADRYVLVMGAYNLPAALKEATKNKNTARAEFIRAMLPLNDLLQAAKPLIVKRKPGDLTPKQAERLSRSMTCQCCARPILANLGTIALHGYERPGMGWQTASCMGAKYLPFEADRQRLGVMIEAMKQNLAAQKDARAEIAEERKPIEVNWQTYDSNAIDRRGYKGDYIKHSAEVTRATFAAIWAQHDIGPHRNEETFDELKARELVIADRSIEMMTSAITAEEKRFAGWKQTHKREGDQWIKLGAEVAA